MKTQHISRMILLTCILFGLTTGMRSQITLNGKELAESDKYEVTQLPAFPGGAAALADYITAELQYPEEARIRHIEGDVIVEFVIGKDGCIGKRKIVRGLSKGCDAEVLRLIDEMPCWLPAAVEGQYVESHYTLPVRFRMKHNI